MIRDLIIKNRSYRRFNEAIKISAGDLTKWIELARFSGSGRNAQPLKFAYSVDEEINSQIFPYLGWAGYLKHWKGPEKGERPVAYIALLKDTTISDKHYCDDGIAMQSILLGAVEDGFGGCMIGSVNKPKVKEILGLAEHLELLWIIALGKPTEEVVIETVVDDNIEYWRDENEVHHVPKRPLNEIIVGLVNEK